MQTTDNQDFLQLFNLKCKEYDEMLLEFEDFKATSRLIENELETQYNDISIKYNQVSKENTKLRQDLMNIKKENCLIESKNEQLSVENRLLKKDFHRLETKIVELENDLDLANSQKRQLETVVEALEKQGNSDCERLVLLQLEYEELILEMKKNMSDITEQLKEKEAEINSLSLNNNFLTPAKPWKAPSTSNISTRHSDIELNSPKFENKSDFSIKLNFKSIEFKKKETLRKKKKENNGKSMKMINEIIQSLDEKIKILDNEKWVS